MIRLRAAFITFGFLALIPIIVSAAFQTQRAQIEITITINVTPNPLGYATPGAASDTSGRVIAATLRLNRSEAASQYRAESLSFASNVVAQNQGAVKVEASVSPNPLGTLLYSNQTGVIISQEAGTTVVYPCEYTVTASTTQAAWTLDHGLFTDFILGGGSASFAGGNVANNTHLATPRPTATPFVVYSDDGGTWTAAATGAHAETFCVDLTVKIPIATSGGTYSSNAVYTLFY